MENENLCICGHEGGPEQFKRLGYGYHAKGVGKCSKMSVVFHGNSAYQNPCSCIKFTRDESSKEEN